jgi:hypothetical protein
VAAFRLPPLFVVRRREGEPYRLFREDGLAVRKRRARRKAARTRVPIPGRGDAQRWSPDFVHDRFANGRHFRILNMADDVTKEPLGPFRRRRFPSGALPRTPSDVERRGTAMIVFEHGIEFTGNAMLAWARTQSLALHRTGKSRFRQA